LYRAEGGAESGLVERDALADAVHVFEILEIKSQAGENVVAKDHGSPVEDGRVVVSGVHATVIHQDGEELREEVVLGVVDGVAENLSVGQLSIRLPGDRRSSGALLVAAEEGEERGRGSY